MKVAALILQRPWRSYWAAQQEHGAEDIAEHHRQRCRVRHIWKHNSWWKKLIVHVAGQLAQREVYTALRTLREERATCDESGWVTRVGSMAWGTARGVAAVGNPARPWKWS